MRQFVVKIFLKFLLKKKTQINYLVSNLKKLKQTRRGKTETLRMCKNGQIMIDINEIEEKQGVENI